MQQAPGKEQIPVYSVAIFEKVGPGPKPVGYIPETGLDQGHHQELMTVYGQNKYSPPDIQLKAKPGFPHDKVVMIQIGIEGKASP